MADWNALSVSIVAGSKQNSTHIVPFTGNIETGKSVRNTQLCGTQAKYITFKIIILLYAPYKHLKSAI